MCSVVLYFIIIPSFFISHVFPDQSSMMSAAIKMATTIASKSPIAVQGTKININYSRDHAVDESLEHMVSFNKFYNFIMSLIHVHTHIIMIIEVFNLYTSNVKV